MTNAQKKILLLILLICGCVLTGIISEFSGKSSNEASNNLTALEEAAVPVKATSIRVYVSGAVVKPGLYDVPFDSRADYAINSAGGVTELADMERVNLAKKLKDGMQVNVPTRKVNRTTAKNNDKVNLNNSSSIQKKTTTKNQESSVAVININIATAAELEQLPGIGPAMAQRIISFRDNKRFESVEDLLKIKGIGKSKLERIKEYVKVE